MSSLNLIDKSTMPPLGEPGSEAWCEEVRLLALERALALQEKIKATSAEIQSLMKIRREMMEIRQRGQRMVWMDPGSWQTDEPKVA